MKTVHYEIEWFNTNRNVWAKLYTENWENGKFKDNLEAREHILNMEQPFDTDTTYRVVKVTVEEEVMGSEITIKASTDELKEGDQVKIKYNRSGIPYNEVGELVKLYISGMADVKLPSRTDVVCAHRSNVVKVRV